MKKYYCSNCGNMNRKQQSCPALGAEYTNVRKETTLQESIDCKQTQQITQDYTVQNSKTWKVINMSICLWLQYRALFDLKKGSKLAAFGGHILTTFQVVDQDILSILGLEISTKLKLVHCIDVISNRAADPDVFQTYKVDLKALVYHKGCSPYCHH